MDNEKIYSSKKELLNYLGIKDNFLYPNFSKKYFRIEKSKKNGGIRIIEPPNLNLKELQRNILDNILVPNKLLDCIYGLSKKKGVVNNAKFHQKNVYNQLLNLDIKDFFPSISKKRVLKIFSEMGFNKENSSILTKICTVNGALPQGAPTSPYLASLACVKLDKTIFNYCRKRSLIYSRYFDDISISGKKISTKNINQLLRIIKKNGFEYNEDKTVLFGCNTSKIINNVMLNGPSLSISYSYRQEIYEAYQSFKKEKSEHNKNVFWGKIGFYLHINKREAEEYWENLKRKV